MTVDPDLPGAAVILQAATLRDTLKRLKEAEYDMANASKPASARQEWMSDLVNAILWAVVVSIPLFTLHMVMLDFEHSRHMPVQFSFGMSLSSMFTTHPLSLTLWVVTIFIAAFSLRRAFRRQEQMIAMRSTLLRTQTQALTDDLTGVWNRRGMETLLKNQLQQAKLSTRPLTILMADIDGLKQYNDTCGHIAADDALRLIAQVMAQQVRNHDSVTRFGGDEFVILCPELNETGATTLVARLEKALVVASLMASFGIATFPKDGKTTQALLETADRRLYEVKAAHHHIRQMVS